MAIGTIQKNPFGEYFQSNNENLDSLVHALNSLNWKLVTNLLFSNGVEIDVNRPLLNEHSVLSYIVSHHQWNLVKTLLDCHHIDDLDFNFQIEIHSHKTSLLWILASNKQWELLRQIIDSPKSSHLNFNARSIEGQSSLWLIAQSGQWDLFKLIINAQKCEPIDLNISPHSGFHAYKSILWLMISDRNHHDLIQCVLNCPCNIQLDFNQECLEGPNMGLTPLFLLISERDPSESWMTLSWIIESYRCKKLDFNVYSKIPSLYQAQKSAFWHLCLLGNEKIICQVIENDKCLIDPNLYPQDGEHQGMTPLYLLVKHGYFDAIKKLLKKYPNLNSKIVPYSHGISENTLYDLLSQLKQEEIMRLL